MKTIEVNIYEFSEFQCPYCQNFYKGTYQDIKKNYVDTGKVNILNELADKLSTDDHEKSLQYANYAYILSKNLKYPKGIAASYNQELLKDSKQAAWHNFHKGQLSRESVHFLDER